MAKSDTFNTEFKLVENPSVLKQLNKLPKHIFKKYEVWSNIIRTKGYHCISLFSGYRDEKLMGDWFGYRSSRLNKQWRVIYKVDKDITIVYVEKITPHKY